MQKEIAKVLKERLISGGGFPFVDIAAGLAQTVEYVEPNPDGNPVTKRMPVSYDTTDSQNCNVTPERALVPDSQKKGVFYFEDNGISFIDRVSGGGYKYRSNLTFVCWMNRARLVEDNYKEVTSYAIAMLLKKIGLKEIINEGNFGRFTVTMGRILPQDKTVFSRYTYDETITQYLRPPFEFFAHEIFVEFVINTACIGNLEFKEGVSCY